MPYDYNPHRRYTHRLTADTLSRDNMARYSAVDRWYRQPETHEQLAVYGEMSRTYYK